MNFIEFQSWGYNAATIGFIGTAMFTILEIWGLWQQNKTIWKNPEKRGASVSIPWFSCFATGMTVSAIYGVSINSVALIFTGVSLGLMHIPILIGLWKFKGYSRFEKILCLLFLGVITAMAYTSAKNWFMLIVSFGGAVFSLAQPYEIWKKKDAGVVEIKLLIVYLLGTFFWIIYSFAVGDWVLEILNPSYFAILALTTILWFKYRQTEPAKTIPVLHTDPI